eukprot:TRINITY_DN12260_c0_g1_i1.p1 TRINITY_DN12260_c0_g1~~TRINITY_DN12260_c0_g1_i1.p1  ORF type:complete len:388 (+),score=101.74 TRINITY_DN12260_c0_g1_i1:144-1307(+)
MPPQNGGKVRYDQAINDRVFLQRRSANDKWPRRLVCLLLLVFALYTVYVLLFGGVFGGQSPERLANNAATRDLQGKVLGLPVPQRWRADFDGTGHALKGGTVLTGMEYEPLPGDVTEDVMEHAVGSKASAAIALETQTMWLQRAAVLAAKIAEGTHCSADDEKAQCGGWIDGALAMTYVAKGTRHTQTPTAPYAVGFPEEHNAVILSHFEDEKRHYLPTVDGCAIFLTQPPLPPPDAGWYIVCNDALVHILSYRSLNDTHYELPWPSGHRRCLSCKNDTVAIPKSVYAGRIVPCKSWTTSAPLPYSTPPKRTLCVNHTAEYLATWTGDPDWYTRHATYAFNHALLTKSVHEAFWVMLRMGAGGVLLAFSGLMVLLLYYSATGKMKAQ